MFFTGSVVIVGDHSPCGEYYHWHAKIHHREHIRVPWFRCSRLSRRTIWTWGNFECCGGVIWYSSVTIIARVFLRTLSTYTWLFCHSHVAINDGPTRIHYDGKLSKLDLIVKPDNTRRLSRVAMILVNYSDHRLVKASSSVPDHQFQLWRTATGIIDGWTWQRSENLFRNPCQCCHRRPT